MIEYKLYFGLNVDGKPKYNLSDVQEFLDTHFNYNAYSLQEIIGQWEGTTENTIILSIIAPDIPSHNRHVRFIASLYCTCYEQECVLLTKQNLKIEFINGKETDGK